MSDELLPCPWCNAPPDIFPMTNLAYRPPGDWGISFDASEGFVIGCVNKMCPMQPHTMPALMQNIELFKYNWNTRSTTPPPEKAVDLGALKQHVITTDPIRETCFQGWNAAIDAAEELIDGEKE